MFIEDWNSFYEQAEILYKNDPLKTRYVLKYIHKSGKLVLKVTDDKVVSFLGYRYNWKLLVLLSARSFTVGTVSKSCVCTCAVPAIQDRPAIRCQEG